MRLLTGVCCIILLASCGSNQTDEHTAWTTYDTVLRMPELEAGMAVDSALSRIEIKSIVVQANPHDYRTYILPWKNTLTDTVNICVDSLVPESFVDSIVDLACEGKDLRLIGMNNGKEIAIPFHTLHRFKAKTDTLPMYDWDYHTVFVEGNHITINDGTDKLMNEKEYFRSFYGDAFHPLDSAWPAHQIFSDGDSMLRFPQRKPYRVTVDQLELEGQNWDEINIKDMPDTAFGLATYNEFVNKIEVYDKVGSFCTMHMAVMDVTPLDVNWNRMMKFFSEHFAVQKALRDAARKYAADWYTNSGRTDSQKELTDEDLRLLYPDRLRWNGRMSGETEHRYDPFDLAPYYWVNPPELATPKPKGVPLN